MTCLLKSDRHDHMKVMKPMKLMKKSSLS